MKSLLLGLLLLGSMTALGACGVPTEDEAQTLDNVPFGLLDTQTPEAPETPGPAEGPLVQIYLVDSSGERLVQSERRLAEPDPPLIEVVDLLSAAPNRAERAQGLTSAFGEGELVAGVDLVGGVASVDLTEQFTQLDGRTQRLAIAQIVFTLTGRPGVGRVSFTLDGQPIDIPRGDGTLAGGSVSRDNYRELFPGS